MEYLIKVGLLPTKMRRFQKQQQLCGLQKYVRVVPSGTVSARDDYEKSCHRLLITVDPKTWNAYRACLEVCVSSSLSSWTKKTTDFFLRVNSVLHF